MFLYLSAALDLSLPYLVLPDEINLGNPSMAIHYEEVQFTTNKGQAFRGKPISFSAAVLKNANNPHATQQFIKFLLSPMGQQLIQAAHFLPSPALVGGDKTSMPSQIQTLLQGDYR
jgi:molybdate/tungstate transport system substrate-binding protein